MLPCRVGMAVSKLRIVTQSMAKVRPKDAVMALSTGSRADVVGLWSQESEATMAILTTMHFRLIASRDHMRPSAWRSATVSWSVVCVSCWSMSADKYVEWTGVVVIPGVAGM